VARAALRWRAADPAPEKPMTVSFALVLLFANAPGEQTTLPRQRDPVATQQQAPQQQGTPTDPLFDREFVATDEPSFVLGAIENARQAEVDARTAAEALSQPSLREAATKIGRQNESTRLKLEKLAQRKGWRVPETIADRTATFARGSDARTGANFIVQQISVHETTLAQFRAQLNGKGDAELKRAVREALPGYQQNLELLLSLKL
jgi:hypothetical protein